MRVVHINTEDSIGGASIACQRLHRKLLSNGLDSHLLVLNQRDKTIPNIHDFRSLHLESLKSRFEFFVKTKHYQKKAKKYFSRLPKYSEPISIPVSPFDITKHKICKSADILHLHWTSRFLDYPSFFHKNKKPIVWTLHDKAPFTGGLHCTTNFPFEDYQSILSKQKRYIKHLIKGANIHVVSPSKLYQSLSEQSELLQIFPHKTIYHGIDHNIFRPIEKSFAREFWGLPTDRKIILFAVSEFNRPLKGMALLKEAIQNMNRGEIFLVTIGKDFPDDLGLPSKNLGLIKDERLMALAYAAADVYVSPSLEESFGLTIAEALSCGKPVVVFDVGAMSELVNEKNGAICKSKSANDLKDGIEKVLDIDYNPDEIASMAQQSLEIDKQAKAYQALYQQLV